MDEATIRQHAEMWALVMEGQAVVATIAGMNANNAAPGCSGLYPDRLFFDAEKQLLEIARRLRDEV